MRCSGIPDSVFVETLPGLLSKLVLSHQLIQHLALPVIITIMSSSLNLNRFTYLRPTQEEAQIQATKFDFAWNDYFS